MALHRQIIRWPFWKLLVNKPWLNRFFYFETFWKLKKLNKQVMFVNSKIGQMSFQNFPLFFPQKFSKISATSKLGPFRKGLQPYLQAYKSISFYFQLTTVCQVLFQNWKNGRKPNGEASIGLLLDRYHIISVLAPRQSQPGWFSNCNWRRNASGLQGLAHSNAMGEGQMETGDKLNRAWEVWCYLNVIKCSMEWNTKWGKNCHKTIQNLCKQP